MEVYTELLALTSTITTKVNAKKFVYWDQLPEIPNSFFGKEYVHKTQSDGDLGEKMASAFREELTEKNYTTLIIGTDCPFVTNGILEKAYLALESSDFVLGPAKDGGYYLLGMREFHPSVFTGIPWSTEAVLSLTINRIKELNLSYSLLEELNDVDTVEDWKEWKQMI